MRCLFVKVVLAAALLTPLRTFSQDDSGLAVYKSGNFAAAIPLLQNAIAKAPNDAGGARRAALVARL